LGPAGQAFQEHARAAFKHMDHAVFAARRAAPCASLMVAYLDEYASAAVDNFVEIAQQVAGAVGMSASGAWAGGVLG